MTTNSVRSRLIFIVLVAGLFILGWALWRQRAEVTRVRDDNERLRRETAAPESAPAIPQSLPATMPAPATIPAPPEAAAADPASAAAAPEEPAAKANSDLVMTPRGMAPPPRDSGLTLAGSHVTPVDGGLQATLQFNPTSTEALGIVAIVVRLPRDGESRILDLAPAGSAPYANVAKRIAEDGKFAVFQGTLESSISPAFTISVSGPAVADVRGTAGIGPYELRIDPAGATVSPK